MPDSELRRLLAGRGVQHVEPDADSAAASLEEAARHLASARAITEADPNGDYQLL